MAEKNRPILVGVAELTQRPGLGSRALDPLSLMTEAASAALRDAGAPKLIDAVDRVAVVNMISWSYADAAGELARRLGAEPAESRYTTIGGNTPQTLLNQSVAALGQGRCRAVLLAGGETGASTAWAKKHDDPLQNWPTRATPQRMDGDGLFGTNTSEQTYGLLLPSLMYPLIETAIRGHSGRSPAAHQAFLGQLFQRFAAVAAEHPNAWFRTAHSAEDIATPSPENRYVGYPYTKRMNAIMAVDQAAAVVITTETEATRLGIDPERWVYPLGAGELNDVWYVTERPKLFRSPAIGEASRRALAQAGCRLDDITAFDFYSCFPAAVELALDALGLTPEDARPLTITGGLPYFGGPGNNYSMHAIVAAAERIRRQREEKVLVSALGWYCTKHAVGVYGSRPSDTPTTEWDRAAAQEAIDASQRSPVADRAEGEAVVEAFAFPHTRDGAPAPGTALLALADGGRALARIEGSETDLLALEAEELVGRNAAVTHDSARGINIARIG